MLSNHTTNPTQDKNFFTLSCKKYHDALLKAKAGKTKNHMKESIIKNLLDKLDKAIKTSETTNTDESAFLKSTADLKLYFSDAIYLIGTRRSIIGSVKDLYTKQTSLNAILASYVKDKIFYDTLEYYSKIAGAPKLKQ